MAPSAAPPMQMARHVQALCAVRAGVAPRRGAHQQGQLRLALRIQLCIKLARWLRHRRARRIRATAIANRAISPPAVGATPHASTPRCRLRSLRRICARSGLLCWSPAAAGYPVGPPLRL